MEQILSEEELIAYAKPWLKAKGFKKNGKRWTKDIGEFTLCFYIQGSCYCKEDYYIRPGIFVNALMPTQRTYGHWKTEIPRTTPEAILAKFDLWCTEWTDKALIKQRLLAFLEWDERNPLEKRRANLVDYEKDPVPAYEFFGISPYAGETVSIQQYILEHF